MRVVAATTCFRSSTQAAMAVLTACSISSGSVSADDEAGLEDQALRLSTQVTAEPSRATVGQGHAETPAEPPAEREEGRSEPFADYMDLGEITAFMESLVVARPDLCQLLDIGDSIEGRDILVLHITGAGSDVKPAVFSHGLQHAREWIAAPVVIYLADHLVQNYDTDPDVADVMDRVDFYLAPCANPDGYVRTWPPFNERLWHKNVRDNGDGTFGVDLNRNWAYGWGGPGSSSATSSAAYHGTAPFSEPETRALRDFVSTHPNIMVYVDFQSFSQHILWPFFSDCVEPAEPDASLFWALGTEMRDLILAVHGTLYEPGPACLTLYEAGGASVDWVYAEQGRFAQSVRLRPENPSTYGFELPAEQILPTCEEILPAMLHLAGWAADQVDTRWLLPDGPPEVCAPGTPTVFDVDIYPIGESTVPGSALLYHRNGGGAYQAFPLAYVGGTRFQATLPAAGCGDVPEFYLSVEGSATGVSYLPPGAPAETFSVSVGEHVVVFADDFETDLAWVTENAGATAGAWGRGVPVNDSGWAYDPLSDADGSGQCYLTENQIGNTDVDNGAVRLYSPWFDMSGGGTIAYDYFLRLTDDSGEDRLLVEANNDDAAPSWVEVAVHDTDGGLIWRHHEITEADLMAAGVLPSAALQLRFTANDADPQSVVEAALDAFAVVALDCLECPTILGDMNGDEAVGGDDIWGFVVAMTEEPFYEPCADVAEPHGGPIDGADLAAFVGLLLAG